MVVLPAPLVFSFGGCVVEMQRVRERQSYEPYDGGLSDLEHSLYSMFHQNSRETRAVLSWQYRGNIGGFGTLFRRVSR